MIFFWRCRIALHHGPTNLCGNHFTSFLCYILPWFQPTFQASFVQTYYQSITLLCLSSWPAEGSVTILTAMLDSRHCSALNSAFCRIKFAIAMHPTAFDPGVFPGFALIQFEKNLLLLYACSITMECKGLYMHTYIDAVQLSPITACMKHRDRKVHCRSQRVS